MFIIFSTEGTCQWLANGWSLLLNFLIGPVLSITGEYLQPKGLAVVSHLKCASFALSKLKTRWLTCFSDISCLWIPPPYADFGSSHQGQSAGRDTSLIIHSKTAWKKWRNWPSMKHHTCFRKLAYRWAVYSQIVLYQVLLC